MHTGVQRATLICAKINYTTLPCSLPCPYCVFWLSCFHGSALLWARCPSGGTEGQLYINILFSTASSSFNLKEAQVIQLRRSHIVRNSFFFLQISLSNNRSGPPIRKKSTEMSVFSSSAGSTLKSSLQKHVGLENQTFGPKGAEATAMLLQGCCRTLAIVFY